MKKYFFNILIGMFLTGMSLQAQNSTNVQQTDNEIIAVIIDIEGMACQEGCADAIRANLEKVSGVTSAKVSFATGKATVDFNSNEVTLDSIKAIITDTKVKNYSYQILATKIIDAH